MPRAAARSEIVRGQRRVAVGEPCGVVAGEAHVQAPVAEVEVGMVVGRLGQIGDLTDEGDRVDERRGHEPGLDPLQQDAPVGQVVAAGELRRGVPVSHAVDRIQERVNTRRARGTGPRAGAIGAAAARSPARKDPHADVARASDRCRVVRPADDGADDRAHHLVAEGVGLDLEAQHPLPEVGPPRSAHPPHQRDRLLRLAGPSGAGRTR